MIRMMKVGCCPSYIAVRFLLIGQLFLVTLSWLLIGQLFLAYDVILAFETCLNLSYLEMDVSKRVFQGAIHVFDWAIFALISHSDTRTHLNLIKT